MDLMALVRSIEELLYEIASWVLFFPLTLWKCVRHPIRMMRYGASELTDKTEHRFAEALSPPILLILTLALLHLIELPPPEELARAMSWLFEDDRNLLIFRAGIFGLLPLFCAVLDLRRKGAAVTRETLRPPFYSHCYLATPFILAVDLALIATRLPMSGVPAIALMAGAAGWYVSALAVWARREAGIGMVHALASTVATLVAFVLILVLGLYALIAASVT
ncbi:hypothetical protein E4191_06245 [Paracoccus liaowanqingii]|uniref:DUF1282 domain-containing protein n=1 Tax=Paracoccus liaowanqingii TaxID=2560053 RepID=A0A4P7HL51_9RHOB|nr:hypothetical protein [Paracoccus liaowanqingii]QBX34353.1 hypothetical protein E4191_06245 [Paracoccus liaowanqingii]